MESFRFYYSFLSPLEKKVYNGIADSISKYETNIRVMGTAGQVKKILPMVWKDNPQFFYVDTTQYSITSAGVVCCINLNFHKNRAEIRSLTPRLEQLGSRFLEEVRRKKMNNLMTIKYVHDFIIRNTVYSQEYQYTRQVYGDVSSITGVLLNRKAVCLGIAMTAKWLLDLAGIPSAVVDGHVLQPDEAPDPAYIGGAEQDDHAWNLVCLNDVWHNMDVTMDLGACQDKQWISYDYFMRSDGVMNAYMQHCFFGVACDRETGSYFVKNRTVLTQVPMIEQYIRSCLQHGKRRIYFTVKESAAVVPAGQMQQILRKSIPCAYRIRYNDRLKIYDILLQ